MTFALSMRLMPAMPMAESSAPIVVGMRQISRAMSTVRLTVPPPPLSTALRLENGSSVAQTIRKMIVRATSRIVRAISFGVLPRRAPSTIAIMRSRKASPGFAVTFMTIQSDRTRVPPVTDEKSPPASRTTGADSPVIADSSTDATPSSTSPSAGIISPASTSTKVPATSSSLDATCQCESLRGSLSTLACTRCFAARSAAACALPRPSARASAPLANSTVNHNQTAMAKMKPAGASACPRSAWIPRIVVTMLPR